MKRDEQTYAIIGAAMEVHKTLGHGFLEAVYQEALAAELTLRTIPFRREVELPVHYKGIRLNAGYRVDFICYEEVIVELKALDSLTGRERAQVINYLKASGLSLALLFNFGASSLQHERLVHNYSDPLRESASSAEGIV
jgi:GxxExxY protein